MSEQSVNAAASDVSAGAEQNPYGGAAASGGPKRVRTRHFQNAKRDGIKITGLTSYDMLTARIFDEAGIDFLLVGDSAGNNVFGYETTLPVKVDDLIPLTRAVAGAVKRAFVVADMPFGSYENGPEDVVAGGVADEQEIDARAIEDPGGEHVVARQPGDLDPLLLRVLEVPRAHALRSAGCRGTAVGVLLGPRRGVGCCGVDGLLRHGAILAHEASAPRSPDPGHPVR